jgi:GNAT superfamily N-acetyltransferase
MLLRDATPADAGTIAALHADSWSHAYRGAMTDDFLDGPVVEDRLKVWRERFAVPAAHQFVIVGEEAGRVIGLACCFGADDKHWGTLLDNLHVHRDRHREGLGRSLLAAVAARCLADYPDAGLYLWVLEQNARARRFYEALGATDEEGLVWDMPGGGRAPSRRYAWPSSRLEELARG